jgi:hypothetical protein
MEITVPPSGLGQRGRSLEGFANAVRFASPDKGFGCGRSGGSWFRVDQLAPEGREGFESGLDQGSELRHEATGVHLPEGLIEETSNATQLAYDGIVRSWHGRNFDSPVKR